MIKIDLPTPASAEWKRWQEKAREKTQELIQQGPPFNIEDRVYKGMRDLLFEAFCGKCAYCECEFSHNQRGDVEHFRPKGGVVDELDRPVRLVIGGAEQEHPGYYWLAYEWTNLLPSCVLCNQLTRTPTGKLIGKGNRFPVMQPFYACCPGEEHRERPVFIHPVLEDPAEDIDYDAATGLLMPKTDRGKLCIDLLGLNRDALIELRRDHYDSVLAKAEKVLVAAEDSETVLRILEQLKGYKLGTRPFSLVGRKAIEDVKERARARLQAL